MSDVPEPPFGSGEPFWPHPKYDLGPPEVIHALGAVSVTFVALEGEVERLFRTYVGLPKEVGAFLFSKIKNNIRIELLRRSVNRSHHTSDLKGDVLHFLKGYTVCTENRNILLHAASEAYYERGQILALILSKSKTSQPAHKNFYIATLELVRSVADGIREFHVFGRALSHYIAHKHGPHYLRPAGPKPSSLPNRPELPILLRAEGH